MVKDLIVLIEKVPAIILAVIYLDFPPSLISTKYKDFLTRNCRKELPKGEAMGSRDNTYWQSL